MHEMCPEVQATSNCHPLQGDVHVWGVFLPRAQWMFMHSFYHLDAFSPLVSPRCLPANLDISFLEICIPPCNDRIEVIKKGHLKACFA